MAGSLVQDRACPRESLQGWGTKLRYMNKTSKSVTQVIPRMETVTRQNQQRIHLEIHWETGPKWT